MNSYNMSSIFDSYFSRAYSAMVDHPNVWVSHVAPVVTITVGALALASCIRSSLKSKVERKQTAVESQGTITPRFQNIDADVEAMQKMAINVIFKKITIIDADAYKFAYHTDPAHNNTVNGTLAYQAALCRAIEAVGRNSKICPSELKNSVEHALNTPEEILHMGQDVLKTRSGQCDHLAAAVIAKIVEHIKAGGDWSSDVEIVGNGRHAFAIINRGENSTVKDLATWDKETIVVDLWLGCVGVKEQYRNLLTPSHFGVISDEVNVKKHRKAFKYCYRNTKTNKEIRLTSRGVFTPEILSHLATLSG